jgi:hypothetical protein
MSFNATNAVPTEWSSWQRILFRFLFLYFVIQVLPLDWKFFREVLSIQWGKLEFYDLFKLTRYYPVFFQLSGFANWAVAAALALVGTAVWTYRGKPAINYEWWYYWLRVMLRYRLAVGIIAYGLIKVFPLQMPYPSLSNLHTNYGDFLGWKIYFHTLGITQNYEIFLGSVEVVAGILLLFRRTATFGAGIIIGFVGNIFAANIAYQAGESVYSAYLLVIALVIFAYDAPRLYRLLVQGRFTNANRFKPVFSDQKIVNLKRILKGGFAFFVILLSVTTYANYGRSPYKLPSTPGLKGAYGFYNVKEFRFNNQVIPYSTTDSNRWQNVVFEKWATMSVKTAKSIMLDLSAGDEYHEKDEDRNFESAGVGGRRYFAYRADTADHYLFLQNKNPHHKSETFRLQFSRPNDSTVVLQGVNEKNDSVYAELNRIERKYMLFEGRRKRVKL